jgi:hypothetical protein
MKSSDCSAPLLQPLAAAYMYSGWWILPESGDADWLPSGSPIRTYYHVSVRFPASRVKTYADKMESMRRQECAEKNESPNNTFNYYIENTLFFKCLDSSTQGERIRLHLRDRLTTRNSFYRRAGSGLTTVCQLKTVISTFELKIPMRFDCHFSVSVQWCLLWYWRSEMFKSLSSSTAPQLHSSASAI